MASMFPQSDAPDVNVVFRASWTARLGAAVAWGLVTLVGWLVMAVLLFWGLATRWPVANPPWWALALAGAILLPWPVVVTYLCAVGYPLRLTLDEHSLRLGGRVFFRTIAYDDVRLVQCEAAEHSEGKPRWIVLNTARRHFRFQPAASQVVECFDALRAMCDHAPAIDADDRPWLPQRAEAGAEAARTLARAYRAKARRQIVAGTLCAVVAVGAIAALAFGGSPARNRARPWFLASVLPVASVGYVAAAIVSRRRAREVESGSGLDDADGGAEPDA